MAIRTSAFVLVDAKHLHPGKVVMSITDQLFDERVRICAFRALTDQLRQRKLITEDEFHRISKKIDCMEMNSVSATPAKNQQPRNVTVVE